VHKNHYGFKTLVISASAKGKGDVILDFSTIWRGKKMMYSRVKIKKAFLALLLSGLQIRILEFAFRFVSGTCHASDPKNKSRHLVKEDIVFRE
jgi:hypothetical protein